LIQYATVAGSRPAAFAIAATERPTATSCEPVSIHMRILVVSADNTTVDAADVCRFELDLSAD
jgi:hypothetical protein